MTAPRYQLYGPLASWWPLLSAPADYAEEAAFHAHHLEATCQGSAHTLLELGSGGGNNASHLKARYALTLVDLSPGMLDVSRALNPDCEHVHADMRVLRLEREFDLVFVHDAVVYMTSEEELRQVMATAFAHLRPGGAALFAPDHLKDTWRPGSSHGGRDAPDGRGLRYLEWTWDLDPSDDVYVVDYAFLLREANGETRSVHDRHVEGVFRRAQWLEWLAATGFEDPQAIPFVHSGVEPGATEILVARRPAS